MTRERTIELIGLETMQKIDSLTEEQIEAKIKMVRISMKHITVIRPQFAQCAAELEYLKSKLYHYQR